MSTDENTPQPTETSQPAQQPLEERGGVMEVVDQVSTVLGGVGGIAGTAYVVKHWNDPPAQAPTPQASVEPATPAVPPAPEAPAE